MNVDSAAPYPTDSLGRPIEDGVNGWIDPEPKAPPLAPPVSRVSGAIGRGLADDLAAKYRRQLDELWRDVLAGLPDD
jgi:hypothetical protein